MGAGRMNAGRAWWRKGWKGYCGQSADVQEVGAKTQDVGEEEEGEGPEFTARPDKNGRHAGTWLGAWSEAAEPCYTAKHEKAPGTRHAIGSLLAQVLGRRFWLRLWSVGVGHEGVAASWAFEHLPGGFGMAREGCLALRTDKPKLLNLPEKGVAHRPEDRNT